MVNGETTRERRVGIRSQLFWVLAGVSVVFNGLLWLVALLVFPKSSPAAVLHYNIGVGIDFIGQGTQIMVLPIVGLVVIVGNTVLGLALAGRDIRPMWLMWSVMPFVQLILLLAFYLLWRLNT